MQLSSTHLEPGGTGAANTGPVREGAIRPRENAWKEAAINPSLEVMFIPLGAGDATHCVQLNGRVFETVSALAQRRERCRLYHSALHAHLDRRCYLIEMAPTWSGPKGDHGARMRGPVGSPALGRFPAFQYEVRCWENGVIPDLGQAEGPPRVVSTDDERLTRLLALTSQFPARTWGRDEQRAGEMWNSNSLISWLLVCSGHDAGTVPLPTGGRAPGWEAGLRVARRSGVQSRGQPICSTAAPETRSPARSARARSASAKP